MRLLAPLTSTLEQLNLGGNKLGGTVTPDIAAFTKLTRLALNGMGLEGASLGLPRHTCSEAIDFTNFVDFAQACSRLRSFA